MQQQQQQQQTTARGEQLEDAAASGDAQGAQGAVRVVQLAELQVFKCVGDEATIQEYMRAHPPREPVSDWAGIYLQLNLPHALGTVGYRWDQGYSSAKVIRATLRDLRVAVLDAQWFADARMDGAAKARAAREALGLAPDSGPLVQALAANGLALACRETGDQWELVIGHAMLPALALEEEQAPAMYLLPDPQGLCTAKSRTSSAAAWTRFDDTLPLQHVPAPAWLETSSPSSTARAEAEQQEQEQV